MRLEERKNPGKDFITIHAESVIGGREGDVGRFFLLVCLFVSVKARGEMKGRHDPFAPSLGANTHTAAGNGETVDTSFRTASCTLVLQNITRMRDAR